MKIIIHYPQSNEEIEELSKTIAKLNCDMLLYRLNNKAFPTWQKKKILEDLILELSEENNI